MSAPSPEPTGAVRLDDDSIERLAQRITQLLAPQPPASTRQEPKLLSAAEVARRWGVQRSWVYEHAAELGAMRLGSGARPRLRFDPDVVTQRLRATSDRRAQPPPQRRRHRRSPAIPADPVELLPIRGHSELRSPTQPTDRPGGAPTPPATAPKTEPSAR